MPEHDLRWRVRWLVTAALCMSHEDVRDGMRADLGGFAGLPLPERVEEVERYIGARGLLPDVEAVIRHVHSARGNVTRVSAEATRGRARAVKRTQTRGVR